MWALFTPSFPKYLLPQLLLPRLSVCFLLAPYISIAPVTMLNTFTCICFQPKYPRKTSLVSWNKGKPLSQSFRTYKTDQNKQPTFCENKVHIIPVTSNLHQEYEFLFSRPLQSWRGGAGTRVNYSATELAYWFSGFFLLFSLQNILWLLFIL